MPVHDDRRLFEMLILEGAQAGLSWITVLRRREQYRAAFDGFDPARIAAYDGAREALLLANPGIIRNRAKIAATIGNARAFLAVQTQHGSFARYLWDFVDGRPVHNAWSAQADVPASSPLAERLSRDLRRRGFSFVGPTICYAYLQAVGLVNDHLSTCFRHRELQPP